MNEAAVGVCKVKKLELDFNRSYRGFCYDWLVEMECIQDYSLGLFDGIAIADEIGINLVIKIELKWCCLSEPLSYELQL